MKRRERPRPAAEESGPAGAEVKLMFAAFLSRVRHGSVFCAYCHDRLRVVIDGDDRYCSHACREADGEQQAMSF